MSRDAHGSGSGPPQARAFPPEVPTDPDTFRDIDSRGGRNSAPRARGELLVRTGPVAGLRFALRDGRISVGRSSRSHCPIHDPAVSRMHFELEVTPDGVWLRDLGSGNGTRLNGRPVEEALLQHGDRILAGNSTLEYRGTSSARIGGGEASDARRATPMLGWKRPILAIGLPGVAAIALISTATLHRLHVRQRAAQEVFARGLAELAEDPPDPQLALADFLAAAPDAVDQHALSNAMAAAQAMARAMQQLARARELLDRKDFLEARRQLQGLPTGSYFDRMATAISREIDEHETTPAPGTRPPTPVIQVLDAKQDPPSPVRRGTSTPAPPRPAATRTKPATQPDDDRAERLCDDADALLAQNPAAARRRYREALEFARPGSAAARRAEGGLEN